MKPNTFPKRTLTWVTIFAIAMGFLETAVVIYMRALLYPKGFAFPLEPIPASLALTEILREAATLIMLIGIGVLAGKSAISRFAWFLYSFAIWDLFYYVFLKALINWPESLLTWDVLFLIPTTWVGPVVAPVIVSLTMILLSVLIVHFDTTKGKANLKAFEWILLIAGSLSLIVSFTRDYSAFILEHYKFKDLWSVPSSEMMQVAMQYVPRSFNWWWFWFSELILLAGIVRYWRRKGAMA
jgi:hypothetical protein